METKQLTIIYDDECLFCNWCRTFVEKRAPRGVFLFLGARHEAARDVYDTVCPKNPIPTDTIVVITETKKTYTKYEACRIIGMHMYLSWRMFAYCGAVLPRRLGNALYDLVSRHRTRLARILHISD